VNEFERGPCEHFLGQRGPHDSVSWNIIDDFAINRFGALPIRLVVDHRHRSLKAGRQNKKLQLAFNRGLNALRGVNGDLSATARDACSESNCPRDVPRLHADLPKRLLAYTV